LILHCRQVLLTPRSRLTHALVTARKIGTNISMLYGGVSIETVPPRRSKKRRIRVKQFITGNAAGRSPGHRPGEEGYTMAKMNDFKVGLMVTGGILILVFHW
jgi:hypothetical protein